MSGTLRELPPSKRTKEKRWELRVYVGRDPDRTVYGEGGKVIKQGPPVHASKVFRGGKREAQKALDAFVAEVGDSKTIGTGATVGKLLDEWMTDLKRLQKARSTIETYEMHIKKHIRPGLGSVRLDKLSVADINRYLGELAAKGLAARTIKLDHAILSAALTFGVDTDWVKTNPAKKAKLTPADRNKDPILTTDQLFEMVATALDEDPDMAVALYLAAATGCRRGELCGLRWNDLDVERGTLRVERQWVTGKGGQHLVEMTKTGDDRTVNLGPTTVKDILDYRKAKATQLGREPDGWLLSYNGGQTPMRAKAMTDYVSRLAKKLKIPATLHTLRHWKDTTLNQLGVDLPTAAAQQGHSVEVMASTYLHTNDERGAAAGELISGVLDGAMDVTALERALTAD